MIATASPFTGFQRIANKTGLSIADGQSGYLTLNPDHWRRVSEFKVSLAPRNRRLKADSIPKTLNPNPRLGTFLGFPARRQGRERREGRLARRLVQSRQLFLACVSPSPENRVELGAKFIIQRVGGLCGHGIG